MVAHFHRTLPIGEGRCGFKSLQTEKGPDAVFLALWMSTLTTELLDQREKVAEAVSPLL